MIELNISGWVKSSITLDSAKMGMPVSPQDRQLSSLFYDTTSKNWYLEVFESDWVTAIISSRMTRLKCSTILVIPM